MSLYQVARLQRSANVRAENQILILIVTAQAQPFLTKQKEVEALGPVK